MRVLITIGLILITSLAYADLYVTVDNNEPRGVSNVQDKSLADWESRYTMIPVDDSYIGKQGYEIKYDGMNIRHATTQEIQDYHDAQTQASEDKKKQRFKDLLEDMLVNDTDIKDKVKALK